MYSIDVYCDGSLKISETNKFAGCGIVIVGYDLEVRKFAVNLSTTKNSYRTEVAAIKTAIHKAKQFYPDCSINIHNDNTEAVRHLNFEDESIKINCNVVLRSNFFARQAHALSRKGAKKAEVNHIKKIKKAKNSPLLLV